MKGTATSPSTNLPPSPDTEGFEAHANRRSAYWFILIGGPWLPVLVVTGFWLARPEELFPLPILMWPALSLVAYLWLRGFRLIVRDGKVSYRDGFYRSREHALTELRSAKRKWVRVSGPPSLPNVVVTFRKRGMPRFWISCNVFHHRDLERFMEIVRAAAATVDKRGASRPSR
ncbi:MAG: hypothetical protein QM755_05025 [Luteolibacter sp.]